MKVGDYVRTNYGITQIKENVCLLDEVIKSSPNIIDLIEIGDYVNGHKVIEKGTLGVYDNRIGDKYIRLDFDSENDLHWHDCLEIQEPDIKSIVTKEQFESMEYKIGE